MEHNVNYDLDASDQRRYEGEDLSPTTMRELRGWFSYGLAAEIYAVCGVGSFLPVTLEQLARQQGVLWSDKSTPCDQANTVASQHNLLARASDNTTQCIVTLFGREVSTASFAMYTFSLAAMFQVITLVSMSSFADCGHYRKKLLLAFGFIGATTSMLFIFVVPAIYIVASILVILGVGCLGSSFAVLNSFLPLLVKNHDSVRLTTSRITQNRSRDRPRDVVEVLDSPDHDDIPKNDYHQSQAIKLSTKISSKGVAIGYAAALSVQVLSIGILMLLTKVFHITSKTLPLRLILFLVGFLWFLFTIPAYLYVRPRPGPSLPMTFKKGTHPSRLRICFASVARAWTALYGTLILAIRLRQTRLCLLAWFLLSDAVATISGTAILFARTELGISTIGIAILSITVTLSGIFGAVGWPRIQAHFKLRTTTTVVTMILLMELIPLYALTPYVLPILKIWQVGGLQSWWEIYPLAILDGFVMGGISTYCRSVYSRLIPPGMEAAFFALFAVTDKGSSAIGPAIVGRIVDNTGSIRPAFGFVAVVILTPAPLMWLLDTEQGQTDAVQLAERLTQAKTGSQTIGLAGGPAPRSTTLQRQEDGAFHGEVQEAEGLLKEVEGNDDDIEHRSSTNHE